MIQATKVKPPEGLKERGRAYWQAAADMYDIGPHDLAQLENACYQLDRAAAFRQAIEESGEMFVDTKGQTRVNPAVAAERQSMLAFLRITREIGLNAEVPETRPTVYPAGYR